MGLQRPLNRQSGVSEKEGNEDGVRHTVTSNGRLPRNTDLLESYSTFFPPPLMLLLTPAARSTLMCLPSNCREHRSRSPPQHRHFSCSRSVHHKIALPCKVIQAGMYPRVWPLSHAVLMLWCNLSSTVAGECGVCAQ